MNVIYDITVLNFAQFTGPLKSQYIITNVIPTYLLRFFQIDLDTQSTDVTQTDPHPEPLLSHATLFGIFVWVLKILTAHNSP